MADVDSVVYTTTERKTRKVKKTTKQRRESSDQNAEVTITEVDSTPNSRHSQPAIEEYVLAGAPYPPLFFHHNIGSREITRSLFRRLAHMPAIHCPRVVHFYRGLNCIDLEERKMTLE